MGSQPRSWQGYAVSAGTGAARASRPSRDRSSHAGTLSRLRMTGIRGCRNASASVGCLVNTVQTGLPAYSRYSPAR